jgi:transposase
MDWCLYGYRHLVENTFSKIKNYRAIATRYDNTNVIMPAWFHYQFVGYLTCCRKTVVKYA